MQMQKGICIEQKNNRSIFILPNGQFMKGRPTANIEVGEEGYFYPVTAQKAFSRKTVWAPILVAVVVLAILFSVLAPQPEAYAYVQVQVNPAVELGINKDGRTESLRGLNKDGKELVKSLSEWKNQPLEQVLDKIINLSIKDTTEEITITTVNDENSTLELEAAVMAISAKAVKKHTEIELKKATKAQWRKSVDENIPVSQLVSDATMIKPEKTPDPKAAKAVEKKATSADAKPRKTEKKHSKQQAETTKKTDSSEKRESADSAEKKKSTLEPKRKELPKVQKNSKETTKPKEQKRTNSVNKEKKAAPKAKEKKPQKAEPKTKETKKASPPKAKEQKTKKPKPEKKVKETQTKSSEKNKETPPENINKKKEAPKETKKEKPKKKDLKDYGEQKKPAKPAKEKKPEKQEKIKENNGIGQDKNNEKSNKDNKKQSGN